MKSRRTRSALTIPRGNVPENGRGLATLSDSQIAFVRAYVACGADVKAAVVTARLALKDPEGTARAWLWRPEVLFAIREEQKRAALVGGSVAIRTLIDVANNPEQSGTARVAAAKALANLALACSSAADPRDDADDTELDLAGVESVAQASMPSDRRALLTRLRRVIFEETSTMSTVARADPVTADQVSDGSALQAQHAEIPK